MSLSFYEVVEELRMNIRSFLDLDILKIWAWGSEEED